MLSKASQKLALPGVRCVSSSIHCSQRSISAHFEISVLVKHSAKERAAGRRRAIRGLNIKSEWNSKLQ